MDQSEQTKSSKTALIPTTDNEVWHKHISEDTHPASIQLATITMHSPLEATNEEEKTNKLWQNKSHIWNNRRTNKIITAIEEQPWNC